MKRNQVRSEFRCPELPLIVRASIESVRLRPEAGVLDFGTDADTDADTITDLRYDFSL